MRYKVDYYTNTGSPSDNDFIGIFDTPEQAKLAKDEYINEHMGDSKEEYCELNCCDEEEYEYELNELTGSMVIEPIECSSVEEYYIGLEKIKN